MPAKPTRPAKNNIRAWRDHRRMTQAQLAEAADMSSNMLSQLESGERGLSAKWLEKLAPALGTTPGFLLDHDPKDLDSAFLETAMKVPKEARDQATEILLSFIRRK